MAQPVKGYAKRDSNDLNGDNGESDNLFGGANDLIDSLF